MHDEQSLIPKAEKARAFQVLGIDLARRYAIDRSNKLLDEIIGQEAVGIETEKAPETKSKIKGKPSQRKRRHVEHLSEDEVMAIRERMANTLLAKKSAFGAVRPLRPDNLSMAIQRQHTGSGRELKYKTIPEVAATLAYGIALGHAFKNGNKRTALVSMLILLNKNKTILVNATEDDLYNLITDLVTHRINLLAKAERNADTEVAALAAWIQTHSRELSLGDRLTRFGELRNILFALGCEFGRPYKNFIKIKRHGFSVKVGYPKHDFNIDAKELKRIRRTLRLDEVHGFDSQGFYDLGEAVDRFVNDYRILMRRLADL